MGEGKAASNLAKHGVSFDEAAKAFLDPLATTEPDLTSHEERWRTIGTVTGLRLVVVTHTVRRHDESGFEVETIRIISARHAERKEQRLYGKDGP